MYDASTGRWLNRDPIGLAGGMNLYGYCGAGPVGAADPSGLRQTGTYWGDVGQVFVGDWNFISGSAQQLVDPYWGHKAARSFLADPGTFESKAAQSLSFWDTDDPAEFGERFAPYIPMVAGVCEMTSSRLSSTAGRIGSSNATRISHYSPETGVPIDMEGYPVFEVEAEVYIKPTGTHAGDAHAANKAMGFKRTPSGMSWHHHQDCGRMQLVDRVLHAGTIHVGGFSIWGMPSVL